MIDTRRDGGRTYYRAHAKSVVAFIYGSVAKGTDRADSDIDLMVVADDLTLEELYRWIGGGERLGLIGSEDAIGAPRSASCRPSSGWQPKWRRELTSWSHSGDSRANRDRHEIEPDVKDPDAARRIRGSEGEDGDDGRPVPVADRGAHPFEKVGVDEG